MAEDIVERLRGLVEASRSRGGLLHAHIFAECADEIERLRLVASEHAERADSNEGARKRIQDGWTRLADEMPPQDGTPFEVRLAEVPGRYFLVIRGEKATGFYADAHQASIMMQAEDFLLDEAGWWRLLPGGEPPC